jgi:hypothetical protein
MIIAVLGIRCKSTARQKKRIAALFQNHRGGYGIRPYQPMHMRTFSARREGVAWFYSRPLISRLFSSATGFSVI